MDLLTRREIGYHKTGTHRRVYLKDVLAFRDKRDQERKQVLDDLAKKAAEDGDYDAVYIPEEGE